MDTPAASPPEPAATKAASNRGRRLLRVFVVTVLFALAAVGGALTGLVLAFQRDLPLIQELENYEPSVITQVFADDGSVIAEFAVEKRVVISYDDVPEHLRLAFVASEDNRFWEHYGVDPFGVARAMFDNLLAGEIVSGASTITQQVSRMLFLTREETVSRKIKEAILAFKIERSYTKREILTFYCNLLHFGHGLYGVEAAAEYYFGKKAKDLTVEESAMLVGIAPAPARYNPFANPEVARTRRDLVLRRMEEESFLTPEEYENARNLPLEFRRRGPSGNIAPYFVEEVRQYLERKYGATRIYRGGLRVHTTLDRATQEAANRADRQRTARPRQAPGMARAERKRPARHEPLDPGVSRRRLDRAFYPRTGRDGSRSRAGPEARHPDRPLRGVGRPGVGDLDREGPRRGARGRRHRRSSRSWRSTPRRSP